MTPRAGSSVKGWDETCLYPRLAKFSSAILTVTLCQWASKARVPHAYSVIMKFIRLSGILLLAIIPHLKMAASSTW